MEIAFSSRDKVDVVLAIFIAATCSLTLKAELFLVSLAILTVGTIFVIGRTRAERAIMAIRRSSLFACLAMLVLWVFGFTSGLLHGWPTGWVVRNYFGLALFLPLLIAVAILVESRPISGTIWLAGIVSLVFLAAVRLLSIFGYVSYDSFLGLGIPLGISEYGLRFYSFGIFPIIAVLALVCRNLFLQISSRDVLKAGLSAIAVLLLLFVSWMITESKGSFLAMIAVLALPFIFERWSVNHIIYAILISVVVIVNQYIWKAPVYSIVTSYSSASVNPDFAVIVEESRKAAEELSSASSDPKSRRQTSGNLAEQPSDGMLDAGGLGNAVRFEQFDKLIEDITWMGRGFGAPLSSGYARSAQFPYGFELSFVNIVHKLGVLSLLYFAFLVYSGFAVWLSKAANAERYACLALLAYLFPSIGNPIVFAVECVFLHALALYVATRRRHDMAT